MDADTRVRSVWFVLRPIIDEVKLGDRVDRDRAILFGPGDLDGDWILLIVDKKGGITRCGKERGIVKKVTVVNREDGVKVRIEYDTVFNGVESVEL